MDITLRTNIEHPSSACHAVLETLAVLAGRVAEKVRFPEFTRTVRRERGTSPGPALFPVKIVLSRRLNRHSRDRRGKALYCFGRSREMLCWCLHDMAIRANRKSTAQRKARNASERVELGFTANVEPAWAQNSAQLFLSKKPKCG